MTKSIKVGDIVMSTIAWHIMQDGGKCRWSHREKCYRSECIYSDSPDLANPLSFTRKCIGECDYFKIEKLSPFLEFFNYETE
jgi:hypothetical protein